MTRIAIPTPRIIIPSRRPAVLPSWLKGRASVYIDPTDDRVTGMIPADLTGAGAFTLLARLYPRSIITATNRGAVSIGTNGADTGAFLGQVVAAGRAYIGGGLIGTTLADSEPSDIGVWTPAMYRYAGGAGGVTTLVVKDRATNGVATANITGVVAELGRLLAAGTCFGGCIADVRILSRAISDAEYDAWRDGIAEPATTRRLWTCENPGYGATCHEEIGNTEDAITGAVWSPDVPFRRARKVEDVAAAPLFPAATLITVASDAAFDVGAGSFSVGAWRRLGKPMPGLGRCVAERRSGQGWLFYEHPTAGLSMYMDDGAGHTLNVCSSVQHPDGWHLVYVVIDRTLNLCFLYADGEIIFTTSVAAIGSLTSATALKFGGGATGSLNDLGVWVGKIVTQDEQEAQFFDGIVPSGATSFWPTREGAGTNAADVIGGRNGTLAAASWTTATRCHARTAA